MGGQTGSQQQQTQQVTQLPPWINDAAQQNYAFAQNAAAIPLQQYQGQMVPDTSQQMQQAWNTAATSANAGMPQFNAASAGYLGALGQTPANITAAQSGLTTSGLAPAVQAAQAATAPATIAQQAKLSTLNGMNLQGYMNPYTQSVINNTLPLMQQQNALSQNQQANAAASANAFGGSRQAIGQGVAQAQGAMNIGEMASQLNQANYAQAQAAGEFDVGQANNMGQFNAAALNQVSENNQTQANAQNQFNAGQANTVNVADMNAANNMGQFNATAANNMGQFNASAQNTAAYENQTAQQAKINSDIQAAGGLAGTGTDIAQQANNAFNLQNTAGAEQMAQAQAQINAQMQKFQQANSYPTQQLGILQSALGMTPYGQSTTGASDTQTQTSTDWGALAGAGIGALGNIFGGKLAAGGPSDRRLKKNLQKLGVEPRTKTPIYAYNWKGERPGAPKSLGPMAQDLKRTIPGSVMKHPATGVLHVHPAVLGALARPAPAGTIGAMAVGGSPMMRSKHKGIRRSPPPKIRGALGG